SDATGLEMRRDNYNGLRLRKQVREAHQIGTGRAFVCDHVGPTVGNEEAGHCRHVRLLCLNIVRARGGDRPEIIYTSFNFAERSAASRSTKKARIAPRLREIL